MADHDLFVTMPERKVKAADVEFRVMRNRRAFGRLLISEGGVVWLPARKWERSRIFVSWTRLDNFARGKE